MFISFPRAAKALLFLPNGVLSATAPAPIVCISVRRETVSIAVPRERQTSDARLILPHYTTLIRRERCTGFASGSIRPDSPYVRFNRRRGNVPHSRFDFGATGVNTE